MCCVMPPASPSVTRVCRIASNSDVLPWSTWPMIVTTGGRGTRASSVSSGSWRSVSARRSAVISTFTPNDSATSGAASGGIGWFRVSIVPMSISLRITSAGFCPNASAKSLTVSPSHSLTAFKRGLVTSAGGPLGACRVFSSRRCMGIARRSRQRVASSRVGIGSSSRPRPTRRSFFTLSLRPSRSACGASGGNPFLPAG